MSENGRPNFARDECGNILKFYCSQRAGEGWIQVTPQNRSEARKPFARFNLDTQIFVTMPRRRMNVGNMRALGRAKRRTDDFLDLVLPMIRDRKKEKEGKKPSIRTGAAARKGAKRRRVAC